MTRLEAGCWFELRFSAAFRQGNGKKLHGIENRQQGHRRRIAPSIFTERPFADHFLVV
jgi:hypothetical protein